MEVLAREKVERDKASLQRRIQDLEEELQQRRNMEITSQNGSNSRNHVSPWSEEHVDEAHHAQPFEDDGFADINENSDHYDEDDDFSIPRPRLPHLCSLLISYLCSCAPAPSTQHAPATHPDAALPAHAAVLSTRPAAALPTRVATPAAQRAAAPATKPVAAPSAQPATAPSVQRASASSVHSVVGRSMDLHRECSATSPMKIVNPTKKNKAPRVSPNDLVGKEVILYALCRSEAVAKATVISTNPKSVLGGQPLGNLYCEVVVKVVMKRDTLLPHPYGDIETLADAKSMPIHWPYNRLRPSKA